MLSRILVYLFSIPCMLSMGACKSGKIFGKKESISNKIIEFDFASPKYPKVKTIEPKQNIELVLLNVPVNAYDVAVNDSLITFPNQQPSQFSQIFTVPELTPVPAEPPTTSNAVNGAVPDPNSAAGRAKSQERDRQPELEDILDSYALIEQRVKNIFAYGDIAPELRKLLRNCSAPQADLIAKANKYIEEQIPTLNGKAPQFPLGIESTVTNEITDVKKNISDFIITAENLKKKYQAIIDDADVTMTLQQFKSLEKQILEKIAIIDKTISNSKILKSKMDEFEKAKVGSTIDEIYSLISTSRKQIRHVISTGFGVDEVLATVSVAKKENINCDFEISGFPVVVVVKGGIKIDFSTGVVFNLGRKDFFDQTYRPDSVYRPDKSMADSIIIRRNRNNNILVPSLGVFMNIYFRGLRQIRLGGMFGASIGADQRLYYHVGGTLIIGKSDRFIIGVGASVAQATTLDGRYDEEQIIKRSFAPSTIPTEKATRLGGYISFTYNLNLIK